MKQYLQAGAWIVVAAACAHAATERATIPPNPAVQKMTRAEYQAVVSQLPPAFYLTPADARKAIEFGQSLRTKTYSTMADRWNRELGRDKDRITFQVPAWFFVYKGWSKAREYEEPDWNEADNYQPRHTVSFFVDMSRLYGSSELQDVRFVLLMPDNKAYHPNLVEDTEITKYKHTYTVSVPYKEKVKGKATVTDANGRSSVVDVETEVERTRQEPRSHHSYSTDFRVTFDLLNPDGTPRIDKDAESIELIIINSAGERRQRFKLKEFTVESLPKIKKK